MLQAEQSLFPAELTLASVRASVFSSNVNIYKAMGGGWVVDADRATTGGQTTPVYRTSSTRGSRCSSAFRSPAPRWIPRGPPRELRHRNRGGGAA